MAERINFTKRTLEGLTLPEKGRRYVYDARTPSLCACVTSKGAKSFYVYRRVQGRPERIHLGTFPELTVEQARKQAAKVNGEIATGGNPQDRKRQARGVMTLGALLDYYLQEHARPHKRTWKSDVLQFNRYLSSWRNRKLDTIRRRDVQALHTRIGAKHGHYAANRLRSLLHTMFALAIDKALWTGENPVRGVKRFREKQRERFLSADELGRFFQSLAVETSEVVRDYLLLLLLTAARRSNLLSMAWRDIDFDRAVWTILDTKAGDSLTVPLTPEALGVLARRRDAAGDSVWVFPSSKSKSGHLQCPEKIWTRVLARAELTDCRLHDLRRTAASWQALSGSSLQVIGKSLGHKQIATTEIYARLTLDPVRESVERATVAMYEAGGVRLLESEKGANDETQD